MKEAKRVTLEDLNGMLTKLTDMAKKIGWQEPLVISEPAVLRCGHCGYNEDVAPEHDYKTNTVHYYCKDRIRCWQIWDEAHGIDMEELAG